MGVIDDLLERADLAIDAARAAITPQPGASLLVRVRFPALPTSAFSLIIGCHAARMAKLDVLLVFAASPSEPRPRVGRRLHDRSALLWWD